MKMSSNQTSSPLTTADSFVNNSSLSVTGKRKRSSEPVVSNEAKPKVFCAKPLVMGYDSDDDSNDSVGSDKNTNYSDVCVSEGNLELSNSVVIENPIGEEAVVNLGVKNSTLNADLSSIAKIDKERKQIKIFLPDMESDSESEDEEIKPKRKITPAGGCSLLSFLPKPKNFKVSKVETPAFSFLKKKPETEEISSQSSLAAFPRPIPPAAPIIHDPNLKVVDIRKELAGSTGLIQSISMEQESAGSAGPAPSALAKRKNQITYLAFQAKQRELDLKNQAADARFLKTQTRARYGF